jgi:DNA-binding XRE family transcriptional regulator
MVNENTVRQRVASAVRKADLNTVSAKQIRRTVEKESGLSQDALAVGKWRTIVKEVIEQTMMAIEEGGQHEELEILVDDSEEEKITRINFLCH